MPRTTGTMKINGLKVVDATKPIVLHILPEDITKGRTKNPSACAAARACIRQLQCEAARVHIGRTYLKFAAKWLRLHTPNSLRTQIISFDHGGSFDTGEYTLMAPPPSHRARHDRHKNKKKSKGTGKKPRRPYHTVTGLRVHGPGH